MSNFPPSGYCPGCTAQGTAGAACPTPTCAQVPRFFIPRPLVRDRLLGTRVAEYLITDVLGSGAYGRVFKVLRFPDLREAGALKLMSIDPTPALREMFEREVRSLQQLAHPNIVRLCGSGQLEGFPFLVMAFMDGHTLRTEMQARWCTARRFSRSEVTAIVSQIAAALDCAHSAGIIHRDIKPENVIIEPTHAGISLRVLDFGLAKFIEQGTRTAAITGTPSYMAPEQIVRRHIGPWTDLFALAVLSFELLFARRLYAETSIGDVLRVKLDPRHDVLSGHASTLSPELYAFYIRALAWETSERFATATAFLDAFRYAIDAGVAAVTPEACGGDERTERDGDEVDRREIVSGDEPTHLRAISSRLEEERAQLAALRTALAQSGVANLGEYLQQVPPAAENVADASPSPVADALSNKEAPERGAAGVPWIGVVVIVCFVVASAVVGYLLATAEPREHEPGLRPDRGEPDVRSVEGGTDVSREIAPTRQSPSFDRDVRTPKVDNVTPSRSPQKAPFESLRVRANEPLGFYIAPGQAAAKYYKMVCVPYCQQAARCGLQSYTQLIECTENCTRTVTASPKRYFGLHQQLVDACRSRFPGRMRDVAAHGASCGRIALGIGKCYWKMGLTNKHTLHNLIVQASYMCLMYLTDTGRRVDYLETMRSLCKKYGASIPD